MLPGAGLDIGDFGRRLGRSAGSAGNTAGHADHCHRYSAGGNASRGNKANGTAGNTRRSEDSTNGSGGCCSGDDHE